MVESILGRGAGAAAVAALVLAAAGCQRTAAQQTGGQAAEPPVTTCADNDAACMRAQAKANEEEAARLAGGSGGAPGAGGAVAAPGVDASAQGGGGGLANGEYDCGDGEHVMGKVDIQGGTFRYRPLEAVVGGFAPYSVDGAGHIQWGAVFPGINDEPPARITDSKVEAWGFNVMFQVTPGSYIDTMSCHAPGK